MAAFALSYNLKQDKNVYTPFSYTKDGNIELNFPGAKTIRNGKNLKYHNDNAELTLNMDTSRILKYDNQRTIRGNKNFYFN